MALLAAGRAVIRVGTHEHASTCIIHDQLVQIAVLSPAQITGVISFGRLERLVIEIKADALRARSD